MKAQGFAERAGMVICGNLPASEWRCYQNCAAVPAGAAETRLLAGPTRVELTRPLGRGKFLIKVGGRSGIRYTSD